jgi:hypothetical protein
MWKDGKAKNQHSHHSFRLQTLVIGRAYRVAWVLELCDVLGGLALRETLLNHELELWQWM